jgi:hypothetical protein
MSNTTMRYPWGEHGTIITSSDPLEWAGLNWIVSQHPQFVRYRNKEIPTGKFAYVKNQGGVLLATDVNQNDIPIQNEDFLKLVNQYVEFSGSKLWASGSLRGDRLVWHLVKTPHKFILDRNGPDVVRAHVLFTNYHNPDKLPDARFMLVRKSSFISLTTELIAEYSGLEDNTMPPLIDDFAKRKVEEWHDIGKKLEGRVCSNEEFEQYVNVVFPLSGIGKSKWDNSVPAQRIIAAHGSYQGAHLGAGTWWHSYNSLCYAIDYLLGHGVPTRLDSSWYGINQKRKIHALQIATRAKIDHDIDSIK